MKNICYLFSFLLFFSSQLYSQDLNIEVHYEQGIGKYKEEVFKTPKILEGVLYVLRANSYSSEFVRDESMSNNIPNENKRYVRGYGAKGTYYRNIKSHKKFRKTSNRGKDLIITHPLKEFNWEIQKESKFIGKYKCYKAIDRNVQRDPRNNKEFTFITTAWFTLDIPVPFGPKNYDGLPGLILEVEIFQNYFIASKIIISDKEIEISEPKSENVITLEEYVNKSLKILGSKSEN